ncbi:hypothetical protein KHQ82_03190 [Mycoplasmatota bacterium]|nr:hypothetical protein KHQ82_03190 [Mycoplasmatota bacterium]
MYYRFSKLARIIIIINIVLTLVATIIHVYNIYRIEVTNDKIYAVMEEYFVPREAAIDILIENGEDLFIGNEFATYFGFSMSIIAQFIYYKYAKYNEGSSALLACFFGFITTIIGGLLLSYMIFSDKSEDYLMRTESKKKNDWEKSIQKHNLIK